MALGLLYTKARGIGSAVPCGRLGKQEEGKRKKAEY
jgi:hypothetical protein